MVELSTIRVFDASDPVEALEYDSQQCRLIISSQHGNYVLYEVGRNGLFIFFALIQIDKSVIQELWFASGRQRSTATRLLTLLRVCGSTKVVKRFLFLCLNLVKCKRPPASLLSEMLERVTATPLLGFAKIHPRDVKTGEKH